MRSDLVFGAMTNVSGRYLLAKLASNATRKLHRPNTRIQDTMNDVFVRFNRVNPMAGARSLRNLQLPLRTTRAKTHSFRKQSKQSAA
jgi:hypothetical protein